MGFTGTGLSHTSWKPFGDNVPERAARLIHEKKMGPAIIVFPDCFTALGGNQYINSPAIGNYADYLTREIIPFVYWHDRPLGIRGSSPYNCSLLPPRPICRKARAGLLFPGGQIGC